jgi:NADH-quinone oxidoreductase subunit H
MPSLLGPDTPSLIGPDSCARLASRGYSQSRTMLFLGPFDRQRSRAPWLGSLLVSGALLSTANACQRLPPAELIELHGASSDELQFGETLELEGDGFALGKPASVRLTGELYRPGRAPHALDLELRARAQSQRELTVPLERQLQSEFFGAGGGGTHATFRGDLQVAIAAKAPGAPPITGTLRGATLEFYPSFESRDGSGQQAALGQSVLLFLGIEVTDARERGLTLTLVAPGSRAARAGLLPGDRIQSAGGLSVLEPSDLVPEPARTLLIGVRRGAEDRAVLLDVDGFRPDPPSSVIPAALLVGMAAVAFLFRASPAYRALGSLFQRWTERRRARRSPEPATALELFRRSLPLEGSLGTLIWLGVGASFLAPILRRTPVDIGLGLLSLGFGSALLLTAQSLISGGRRGARWSLAAGLRTGLQRCAVIAPAAIAVLSACLSSGVDADELVQAQGVLPWQWNAFANPGFALSFLLILGSSLARTRTPGWSLHHAQPPAHLEQPAGDGVIGAIYAHATCALCALVFLGGDAWPANTPDPTRGALLATLPTLLLFAKYTLLSSCVGLLRRSTWQLTLEEWAPLSLRYCLPLSVVAAVLGSVWRGLPGKSALAHWALGGVGALGVAVALGVVAAAFGKFSASVRRGRSTASLSPWI